jgi:phenylpropionate dioxygenase-like ring-hydroxylating dioxygenase large terminal subunit
VVSNASLSSPGLRGARPPIPGQSGRRRAAGSPYRFGERFLSRNVETRKGDKTMSTRLVFGLGCLLALMLVVVGCGQGTVGPQETEGEPGEIEDLVYNTTANWQSKEDFDALFAQGATLSDQQREQFQGLFISPVEDTVQIDGNSATVQVRVVRRVDGEDVESTVTWEAIKQGDQWKLQTAPLE